MSSRVDKDSHHRTRYRYIEGNDAQLYVSGSVGLEVLSQQGDDKIWPNFSSQSILDTS